MVAGLGQGQQILKGRTQPIQGVRLTGQQGFFDGVAGGGLGKHPAVHQPIQQGLQVVTGRPGNGLGLGQSSHPSAGFGPVSKLRQVFVAKAVTFAHRSQAKPVQGGFPAGIGDYLDQANHGRHAWVGVALDAVKHSDRHIPGVGVLKDRLDQRAEALDIWGQDQHVPRVQILGLQARGQPFLELLDLAHGPGRPGNLQAVIRGQL